METVETTKKETEAQKAKAAANDFLSEAKEVSEDNMAGSHKHSVDDSMRLFIKNWFAERTFREKLTAILLWELTYADRGTDGMASEIIEKYQQEIMLRSSEFFNIEDNKGEPFLVGLATSLIVAKE